MAKARLTKRINVRVSTKFKEALERTAASRGIKDADLIRQALEKLIAEKTVA